MTVPNDAHRDHARRALIVGGCTAPTTPSELLARAALTDAVATAIALAEQRGPSPAQAAALSALGLGSVRELVERIQNADNDFPTGELAEQLAAAVADLDRRLSAGGPLPEPWVPAAGPIDCEYCPGCSDHADGDPTRPASYCSVTDCGGRLVVAEDGRWHHVGPHGAGLHRPVAQDPLPLEETAYRHGLTAGLEAAQSALLSDTAVLPPALERLRAVGSAYGIELPPTTGPATPEIDVVFLPDDPHDRAAAAMYAVDPLCPNRLADWEDASEDTRDRYRLLADAVFAVSDLADVDTPYCPGCGAHAEDGHRAGCPHVVPFVGGLLETDEPQPDEPLCAHPNGYQRDAIEAHLRRCVDCGDVEVPPVPAGGPDAEDVAVALEQVEEDRARSAAAADRLSWHGGEGLIITPPPAAEEGS